MSVEIARIADQTTYGGKTILAGFKADSSSIYGAVGNGNGATQTGKITFQIGANSGDTINLEVSKFQLSNIAARAGGTAGTDKATNVFLKDDAAGGAANSQWYFNLGNVDTASSAISYLDEMLKDVDTQRSTLGAIQNRLESSIRVQSNVATNESDARSRIRDTDFAEESANLSQQSIIQQAATSMLMQANARPQIGLSLLG